MATSRSVDIQSVIDEQPFSAFQWTIFALCLVVVILDGFDTSAIGYIAPSLVGEWHVSKPALVPVLTAALFGLAFGALSSGPLADRLGRKTVLIGAVAVFGVACLSSAGAGSLDHLVIWRFVTGLGLGAAMPNAVTMVSEFCPTGRRAIITNAMFCGFPIGAAFGGFVAAWMIPQWGWRSVLIAGGAVPLVLAVLLILLMPESVRYMVAKGRPVEKIRAVLRRISADAADADSYTLAIEAPQAQGKSGIGLVLSGGYIIGSIMLWLAYFMGLVIFYGLINWLPILLHEAGLSPAAAGLSAAMFPLGGFGAILSGWLMDRFSGNKIVAFCYAATAIAVFVVGRVVDDEGLLVLVLFVAGALMNTAQSSLPALAAAFYPTQGRATGVAWMLGIGRFGGIAGSFLVAQLSAAHLSFPILFLIVAIPGLISAAALMIKQAVHPDSGPARGGPVLGH